MASILDAKGALDFGSWSEITHLTLVDRGVVGRHCPSQTSKLVLFLNTIVHGFTPLLSLSATTGARSLCHFTAVQKAGKRQKTLFRWGIKVQHILHIQALKTGRSARPAKGDSSEIRTGQSSPGRVKLVQVGGAETG